MIYVRWYANTDDPQWSRWALKTWRDRLFVNDRPFVHDVCWLAPTKRELNEWRRYVMTCMLESEFEGGDEVVLYASGYVTPTKNLDLRGVKFRNTTVLLYLPEEDNLNCSFKYNVDIPGFPFICTKTPVLAREWYPHLVFGTGEKQVYLYSDGWLDWFSSNQV